MRSYDGDRDKYCPLECNSLLSQSLRQREWVGKAAVYREREDEQACGQANSIWDPKEDVEVGCGRAQNLGKEF
jgi:hypothetical protein